MIGKKFLTTEEDYAFLTDLKISLPNQIVKSLQQAAFEADLIDYQYYLKANPISQTQSTVILMTQELPSLNEIEKYYWFVKGFLFGVYKL